MRLQGTKLLESLRLELSSKQLNRKGEVQVRCQLVRELEASGAYEDAREALGDLWRGVGERPAIEALEKCDAAEVLVRVGALTGRFGKGKGIKGAQEKAIDLISESVRIFESLGDPEKVAEAWTEVGFCYWQKGEYEEARVALHTALELLKHSDSEIKAIAIIRTALNDNSSGRHYEAYKRLREEGSAISTYNSHYISGLYHSTLANVLIYLSADEKQARAMLGETGEQSFADRSLVEQTAAGYHFERAGHLRHAARVRNNTGYILFTQGRFVEAHENLDRARRIFQDLKEEGSTAQVDETRARVFLAQGNLFEAEKVALGARMALAKGDDAAQLAQALTTHGRVLAHLGRYSEAKEYLEQAIETATTCNNREGAGQACLTLIEGLADVLPPDEVWARYEQADELLSNTQQPETISRLRACARFTLSVGKRVLRTDAKNGWTGCNLEEEVRRFEGELIDQAMAAEQGSITRAARRLGLGSHQALRNIINGRQKYLLGKKYSARPRKSSNSKASRAQKFEH